MLTIPYNFIWLLFAPLIIRILGWLNRVHTKYNLAKKVRLKKIYSDFFMSSGGGKY